MTRSVYVVGGAGSGKSTFTGQLIDRLELRYGPLVDLYSQRNAKALVTLRGHELLNPAGSRVGMYLGVKRDSFPGTDGLDRASSPTGAAWLAARDIAKPPVIIAEGATLATKPFLAALRAYTDLLLVHLWAPPEEIQRRFFERGSNQAPTFVATTVTRSANRAAELDRVLHVDSSVEDDLDMAFDLCETFLLAGVARCAHRG